MAFIGEANLVGDGDSFQTSGDASARSVLEEKLEALKAEIEETERKLERTKIGELIAEILNRHNTKALLDQLSEPFVVGVIWDAERKAFRAMVQPQEGGWEVV